MTKPNSGRAAIDAWLAKEDPHYECEDSWYSCSQHPSCADDRRAGYPCDCGADQQNEMKRAIAELLKGLK